MFQTARSGVGVVKQRQAQVLPASLRWSDRGLSVSTSGHVEIRAVREHRRVAVIFMESSTLQ